MKYSNPIIPGFHPDPSVCRVGRDFYLVNSSFEYFPGVPVYHSRDLVHWEQIGHCLTRNSQVTMQKGAPNCLNIYAPTIRYHNGIFYMIVTNVSPDENGGNFIVTAANPAGEWSEPIPLPLGGIDPSLFFDDDGRIYYTGSDNDIYLSELDPVTWQPVGEKQYVWQGTGANNPEGPHLYKINGMYYLMLAEGGTELCHMATIARSSSILGPYESCPHNPVLTNIGCRLPIKAAGHADLFDDADGNWWAVCLGIRPLAYPFRHNLGRETMLVPVTWQDGWPVMGENGAVPPEIEIDRNLKEFTPAGYVPGSEVHDDFRSERLHPSWNYIYNPVDGLIHLSGNGLELTGNSASISDDEPKAWLGRRQEHFCCTVSARLTFVPKENGEEAGLTVYMNNRHHYEIAKTCIDGRQCIILRRQIGSLKAIENILPCISDTVTFKLTCTREYYGFSFSENGSDYQSAGGGEASYLTTEAGGCFTGNYIALYAGGNGKENTSAALFTSFDYVPETEKN